MGWYFILGGINYGNNKFDNGFEKLNVFVKKIYYLKNDIK